MDEKQAEEALDAITKKVVELSRHTDAYASGLRAALSVVRDSENIVVAGDKLSRLLKKYEAQQ